MTFFIPFLPLFHTVSLRWQTFERFFVLKHRAIHFLYNLSEAGIDFIIAKNCKSLPTPLGSHIDCRHITSAQIMQQEKKTYNTRS
jgi:hypothetical protein